MVVIGYDSADSFVSQQVRRGNDVRWDGWDMVFWYLPKTRPEQAVNTVNKTKGDVKTGGARRNGVWGLETRVSPSTDGTWNIPPRSVKFARKK